mgnify:CR=1 FL=1
MAYLLAEIVHALGHAVAGIAVVRAVGVLETLNRSGTHARAVDASVNGGVGVGVVARRGVVYVETALLRVAGIGGATVVVIARHRHAHAALVRVAGVNRALVVVVADERLILALAGCCVATGREARVAVVAVAIGLARACPDEIVLTPGLGHAVVHCRALAVVALLARVRVGATRCRVARIHGTLVLIVAGDWRSGTHDRRHIALFFSARITVVAILIGLTFAGEHALAPSGRVARVGREDIAVVTINRIVDAALGRVAGFSRALVVVVAVNGRVLALASRRVARVRGTDVFVSALHGRVLAPDRLVAGIGSAGVIVFAVNRRVHTRAVVTRGLRADVAARAHSALAAATVQAALLASAVRHALRRLRALDGIGAGRRLGVRTRLNRVRADSRRIRLASVHMNARAGAVAEVGGAGVLVVAVLGRATVALAITADIAHRADIPVVAGGRVARVRALAGSRDTGIVRAQVVVVAHRSVGTARADRIDAPLVRVARIRGARVLVVAHLEGMLADPVHARVVGARVDVVAVSGRRALGHRLGGLSPLGLLFLLGRAASRDHARHEHNQTLHQKVHVSTSY